LEGNFVVVEEMKMVLEEEMECYEMEVMENIMSNILSSSNIIINLNLFIY
nr:hypothetical protein [Tanacetum cinerariifolium]